MKEIAGQPEALRRAAEGLQDQVELLTELGVAASLKLVVFTGMGGSYDTCYAPVTALAGRGLPVTMVDSAELLHFRRPMLNAHTLVVAVSQSGESAEVVKLAGALAGGPEQPTVVSVTNGLGNSLARIADLALDTRAGPELGPSTMTFAGALVAHAAIVELIAGGSPEAAVAAVTRDAEAAAAAIEALLEDPVAKAAELGSWLGERRVLALLGRGTARAASEMGSLTIKEAARFAAESLQAAQYRHGPLEMTSPDTAVIVIATEEATRSLDLGIAADLVAAGAAVLVVSPDGTAPEGAAAFATGSLPRLLSPAAAILPVQLLAWRMAVDRGYQPGTYTVAAKVTTRE